jgi:hypothetical protein
MSNLFPGSATRSKEEENKDINNNVNDNINNNINVNKDENINENDNGNIVNEELKVKKKANEDILELLKDNNDKKVVGFHLDKDVRDAFQKVLGKKPPRGAQSKLANKIFRDFFEERGLL